MAVVALRPFADELAHFHNTLATLKKNLHDIEAAFELTVKVSETKLTEAQDAHRKAESETECLRKERDAAEAKVHKVEGKYERECEKTAKLEEKLERRREAQLKAGSAQKEASAAADMLAKLRREVSANDSDASGSSSSSPPPSPPRKSVASPKARRASSCAASTERRPRRDRSDSESNSDSDVRGRRRHSLSVRTPSIRRRGRSASSSSDSRRGSRRSRSRSVGGRGRSEKGRGKGSGDAPLCIPFILGKCLRGARCLDRHPPEEDCRQARESLQQKDCRFGKDCRRKDCIFRHPGRQ